MKINPNGGYTWVKWLKVGDAIYYEYLVGYGSKSEERVTCWWVDRIRPCKKDESLTKLRLQCAWTSITIVLKNTDRIVKLNKSTDEPNEHLHHQKQT